jgi:hypothetical protein
VKGHTQTVGVNVGETVRREFSLRGLDPAMRYRIRETNLAEGERSRLSVHDQVLDGQALMDEGFNSPLRRSVESAVIELVAER